jgi:glycosyltransferase involved in cell wall biosynthesis
VNNKVAVLTGLDFSVLGGAERHILDLARALRAEVVCPQYDPEVLKEYDSYHEIRVSSLGVSLPPEPRRQVSGFSMFRRLRRDFDAVVCMDDMAMRYLVREIPHLYYLLSPRRALYDMYYPYLNEKHGFSHLGYWAMLNLFRTLDRRFVSRYVRHMACNSHNVRNRVFKAYQRDATVLYPPVHTGRYYHLEHEGFWLSVGRVDKWKRVPLQIEAFRAMPEERLVVAGPVYPAYEETVRTAPSNVEFLGVVPEQRLLELYASCTGVIATAIDEDFGLTPVEAMASGKPVVAVKEGGYLETVLDGVTGVLVAPKAGAVCAAVREVGNDPEKYCDACRERAKGFDYTIFAGNASGLVKEILDQNILS